MGRSKRALAGATALAVVTAGMVSTGAVVVAQDDVCNIGVSWNNFQQERWNKTDKPGIKNTVEAAGATYSDFDADLNTDQQLTDVQTLIEQGADVLIILPQDNTVIDPAIQAAKDNNIPVIGYDRLIEDPYALYISFDNIRVGQAEAEAMLAKVPEGNYVLVKGDPGDPNASAFLPTGWDLAGLAEARDSGAVNVIDEWFTDAWDTTTAQNNMDATIQKANADGVEIDAVLAENDSTARGVAASLVANGLAGIPVSGQDGDAANLNNVAKGLQYVDVWKDSNWLGKVGGEAALQLCAGVPVNEVTISDELWAQLEAANVAPGAGPAAVDFDTPGLDKKLDSGDENTVSSILLGVTPVTAESLNLVLDSGWIDQAALCDGVTADMPGAAACGAS